MAITLKLPKNMTLYEKGSQIEGLFTPADGESYIKLVKDIKNGQIAEIGVYRGLSLSYIYPICKKNNTKITGIDRLLHPKLQEGLDRLGNTNTIDILIHDMRKAAAYFKDEYFDLVFIDVPMNETLFRKTSQLWLTKVKNGGILSGHDYVGDSTTKQNVDAVFKNVNVDGAIWWIKKEYKLM